jgi:hypothetical protein
MSAEEEEQEIPEAPLSGRVISVGPVVHQVVMGINENGVPVPLFDALAGLGLGFAYLAGEIFTGEASTGTAALRVAAVKPGKIDAAIALFGLQTALATPGEAHQAWLGAHRAEIEADPTVMATFVVPGGFNAGVMPSANPAASPPDALNALLVQISGYGSTHLVAGDQGLRAHHRLRGRGTIDAKGNAMFNIGGLTISVRTI